MVGSTDSPGQVGALDRRVLSRVQCLTTVLDNKWSTFRAEARGKNPPPGTAVSLNTTKSADLPEHSPSTPEGCFRQTEGVVSFESFPRV